MTEAIPASEELISICLAAVRQLGPGAENPDGLSDSCREVLRWVANRFDRPLDLPEPRDPMLPAMVDATLRQCAALHELDLDGLDFYREEWPYEESGPGVVTPQCLCDLLEAMLADSAGTLRGGLGAYYTPFREVELLCRLLLLAQLSSRLGHIPGATETVRRILFPGELEAPSNARALLLDPMNLELYREVDDAIAETSWCDPACGGK
ncbi:MAG: hypothetical protein FJ109_14535, partial [Deltaproteobacteria bacterium]|nr:hypothetical protein [Deltaproteobacteria bacterium]